MSGVGSISRPRSHSRTREILQVILTSWLVVIRALTATATMIDRACHLSMRRGGPKHVTRDSSYPRDRRRPWRRRATCGRTARRGRWRRGRCPGKRRPARSRTGRGLRKRSVRIELGHDNSDRGSASGQVAAERELIAAADVEGDLPHSGEILGTAQIAAEICSQGMPRGNPCPPEERIRGVWCTPRPIDHNR